MWKYPVLFLWASALVAALLLGGCYMVDLGPAEGENIERCQVYCRNSGYNTGDLRSGRYCECHNVKQIVGFRPAE